MDLAKLRLLAENNRDAFAAYMANTDDARESELLERSDRADEEFHNFGRMEMVILHLLDMLARK